MNKMAKFRKKPIVIEAVKFDHEIPPLPSCVYWRWNRRGGDFYIKTLEGEMNIKPGDWIITGVEGERYPCKPSVFEATYEAVIAEAPTSLTSPYLLTSGQCFASTRVQ